MSIALTSTYINNSNEFVLQSIKVLSLYQSSVLYLISIDDVFKFIQIHNEYQREIKDNVDKIKGLSNNIN